MSLPTSDRADLGIYVHVPFCERVCPYCDFAVIGVGRLAPAQEEEWAELVLRELQSWAPRLAGRRIETVYFGGGTPGLVEPHWLGRVLEALARAGDFRSPELTVELNPGAFEMARLADLRALGVNRLSVGVQSLDGEVLHRLGRAQTAADARAGLEACLGAGFASVSADLIYGAPGQTEASLGADLEAFCALGVPHVSAYALTLEPGTSFARAAEAGRLVLPDENAVFEMSELVRHQLEGAGLAQYEISSYARPGHRSRHNQRYWTCRDVLGLGPSAASLFEGRRLRNARTLSEWGGALRAGRPPQREDEPVSTDDARRERLYLGLRRLEGVLHADFEREFGAPIEAFFAAELARLRARELVEDAAGALRLTTVGRLFADDVFAGLLGPLTLAKADG